MHIYIYICIHIYTHIYRRETEKEGDESLAGRAVDVEWRRGGEGRQAGGSGGGKREDTSLAANGHAPSNESLKASERANKRPNTTTNARTNEKANAFSEFCLWTDALK